MIFLIIKSRMEASRTLEIGGLILDSRPSRMRPELNKKMSHEGEIWWMSGDPPIYPLEAWKDDTACHLSISGMPDVHWKQFKVSMSVAGVYAYSAPAVGEQRFNDILVLFYVMLQTMCWTDDKDNINGNNNDNDGDDNDNCSFLHCCAAVATLYTSLCCVLCR